MADGPVALHGEGDGHKDGGGEGDAGERVQEPQHQHNFRPGVYIANLPTTRKKEMGKKGETKGDKGEDIIIMFL